ncbi:MAG: prohibitin family protein [Candidatus Margulisiibacteriota bacterium]
MDGLFGLILIIAVIYGVLNASNLFSGKEGKIEIFSKEGVKMNNKLSPLAITGIAILLLIVITISQGVRIIGAGERGVIFNTFTGVRSRVLGEGLHIVVPFIEQITKYNVRVQTYSMTRRPDEGPYRTADDSLWAPTKDGLKVGVDLTIRFHPDPTKLNILHQNIGPDYVEKIVRPQIRSITRMEMSAYDIMEVYSNKGRTELQENVFGKISKAYKDNNVICDELLIRDVFFTPEFEKTIENKKAAEQRRQQALIDAESARIEAQGKADALTIVNQAIGKNPRLLEYKWIDKLAGNVKVIVVPKGSNTLIDPSNF